MVTATDAVEMVANVVSMAVTIVIIMGLAIFISAATKGMAAFKSVTAVMAAAEAVVIVSLTAVGIVVEIICYSEKEDGVRKGSVVLVDVALTDHTKKVS